MGVYTFTFPSTRVTGGCTYHYDDDDRESGHMGVASNSYCLDDDGLVGC